LTIEAAVSSQLLSIPKKISSLLIFMRPPVA
jgi:hypothetical protein